MTSFSAAASSSSATARVEKAAVRVEKATSQLLIGPDWTMNMDICDTINNDQWQAKDVLKAVKKRMQNKNPKVQFFALTLLETMVKNCGEYVHFQLAERKILEEMIKIVRKKTDMQVRDKILVLLDSWQEAFGGPSGKYPQYYGAYTELKRSGVHFPRRSANNTPPIFTPPPVTRSALSSQHAQSDYGVPSLNSSRLDEAMASDMGNLSLSQLSGIQDVMELLREMLQAVNPTDRKAVEDELIVQLVSQCRSNQKRLMQLISSTECRDEKLLGRGLELNDGLQSLLNKHDAIAAGTHVPDTPKSLPPVKPTEPPAISSTQFEDEDENEEDGFTQLAQRNSKLKQVASGSTPVNNSATLPANQSDSSSSMSNALVPLNPPPPARLEREEQQRDMIDLSIVLSSTQGDSKLPGRGSEFRPSHLPFNQSYAAAAPSPYGSYVAPWAQQQVLAPPTYVPPPLSYSPRAAVNSSYQPSLQHYNSFGADANPRPNGISTTSSKPYVLPNRLFEDLIDFRSSTTGQKISTRSALSDASSRQPMIGGKK